MKLGSGAGKLREEFGNHIGIHLARHAGERERCKDSVPDR
jgi:hypothetical protein